MADGHPGFGIIEQPTEFIIKDQPKFCIIFLLSVASADQIATWVQRVGVGKGRGIMRGIATVVLLGLLAGSAGQANAGLIVNGSFEADDWTLGGMFFGTTNSVSPTGWSRHTSGTFPIGIHVSNDAYSTPYGSQFVVLGGFDDRGTSWLEQTITGFTVGDTYELSFAISSEYDTPWNPAYLQVGFTSGSATPTQTFSVSIPGGANWKLWQSKTYDFVAGATTATLHLNSLADGPDVGIDNFQLADITPVATPEPSTLLGAVTGILIIVAYAWRKRHKARVAAA